MKQIIYLWFPLLFAWFALNLEEVIYIPIAASLGNIKDNLAAFNLAYSLVLLCESFLYPVLSGSNVFSSNKQKSKKFFKFTLSLALFFAAVILLCSTAAVSEFIFQKTMKLNFEITKLAAASLLIMSITPILVGYRRFFQGILIGHEKSKFITASSIARLLTIIFTSFILAKFIHEGALIVSLGMISGMFVDALISRIACREFLKSMPQEKFAGNNKQGFKHLLYFYLPLGVSSMVLYLSLPIMNFFASYGAYPVESIASLGAVTAFMYLLKSFGVSFQEAVITIYNKSSQHNSDLKRVMYYIFSLTLIVSLIVCFSKLINLYLYNASGLTVELTEFSIFPIQLLFFVPSLTVLISYFKGIFIKIQQTKVIFISAIIEIASLSIVLTIGLYFANYPAIQKMAIAIVISNFCVSGYLFFAKRALEAAA